MIDLRLANPSNDDYQIEIDKKDPLNRFNGLFDGRSYGEGRFVVLFL